MLLQKFSNVSLTGKEGHQTWLRKALFAEKDRLQIQRNRKSFVVIRSYILCEVSILISNIIKCYKYQTYCDIIYIKIK